MRAESLAVIVSSLLVGVTASHALTLTPIDPGSPFQTTRTFEEFRDPTPAGGAGTLYPDLTITAAFGGYLYVYERSRNNAAEPSGRMLSEIVGQAIEIAFSTAITRFAFDFGNDGDQAFGYELVAHGVDASTATQILSVNGNDLIDQTAAFSSDVPITSLSINNLNDAGVPNATSVDNIRYAPEAGSGLLLLAGLCGVVLTRRMNAKSGAWGLSSS